MSAQTARNYKATFILDTRGYDEAVETIYDKLKDSVKAVGGEPGELNPLGRIDFVRVTEREHTGDHYIELEFEGPADSPDKLIESMRLNKTVKRVMVERAD